MVEADGVLAQEAVLLGNAVLVAGVGLTCANSPTETGKKAAVPSGKIRQGPKPRRTEDAESAAALKPVRARVGSSR
jgi:hypothetical protein